MDKIKCAWRSALCLCGTGAGLLGPAHAQRGACSQRRATRQGQCATRACCLRPTQGGIPAIAWQRAIGRQHRACDGAPGACHGVRVGAGGGGAGGHPAAAQGGGARV